MLVWFVACGSNGSIDKNETEEVNSSLHVPDSTDTGKEMLELGKVYRRKNGDTILSEGSNELNITIDLDKNITTTVLVEGEAWLKS